MIHGIIASSLPPPSFARSSLISQPSPPHKPTPADLQRQRIECSQRCHAFEDLQKKMAQAEGEGASGELAELEKEERAAERDVRGAEEKAAALGPRMGEVAQALQDQDQVRRQIDVRGVALRRRGLCGWGGLTEGGGKAVYLPKK